MTAADPPTPGQRRRWHPGAPTTRHAGEAFEVVALDRLCAWIRYDDTDHEDVSVQFAIVNSDVVPVLPPLPAPRFAGIRANGTGRTTELWSDLYGAVKDVVIRGDCIDNLFVKFEATGFVDNEGNDLP